MEWNYSSQNMNFDNQEPIKKFQGEQGNTMGLGSNNRFGKNLCLYFCFQVGSKFGV